MAENINCICGIANNDDSFQMMKLFLENIELINDNIENIKYYITKALNEVTDINKQSNKNLLEEFQLKIVNWKQLLMDLVAKGANVKK